MLIALATFDNKLVSTADVLSFFLFEIIEIMDCTDSDDLVDLFLPVSFSSSSLE